jgi:hypothetical protein
MDLRLVELKQGQGCDGLVCDGRRQSAGFDQTIATSQHHLYVDQGSCVP